MFLELKKTRVPSNRPGRKRSSNKNNKLQSDSCSEYRAKRNDARGREEEGNASLNKYICKKDVFIGNCNSLSENHGCGEGERKAHNNKYIVL